jgi:hypothetical protein
MAFSETEMNERYLNEFGMDYLFEINLWEYGIVVCLIAIK